MIAILCCGLRGAIQVLLFVLRPRWKMDVMTLRKAARNLSPLGYKGGLDGTIVVFCVPLV